MLTTESVHRRAWRRLRTAAAVLVPAAVLLCSPGAARAATTAAPTPVALTKVTPCAATCIAFTPATGAVPAGSSVIWTDPSGAVCTLKPLVSPDPAFTGGRLPGYTFAFKVPGSYTYGCLEYPAVRGGLTVIRAAGLPITPVVLRPTVIKPAAKLAAASTVPVIVIPHVVDHTPWYVPSLFVVVGVALALAISRYGSLLNL